MMNLSRVATHSTNCVKATLSRAAFTRKIFMRALKISD